jgi:RNA polymerase sigma factor (sigma-70 family)
VIRSQQRQEVLAALAALPTRRREVLVLRYFLGLSEAEIAATLSISNGSVKSAAARGLAALAKALGEEAS